MIQTWRIVHEGTLASAFSGDGSRKNGGRWNSRGYRAVYTAESLVLATLEIAVHGVPCETLQRCFCIPVKIPEHLVIEVDRATLPNHWRKDSPPEALQDIGNQWIAANRSDVLKVSSAVIPVEFNYLIHSGHADFTTIAIGREQRHTLGVQLTEA